MVTEILNKWIFLVNTISSASPEGIDFPSLDAKWESRFGCRLPKRSFYNMRDSIAEITGIEIRCNRSTNLFFISPEDLDSRGKAAWMINAFSIGQLQELKKGSLSGRIVVSEVPSGQTWLMTIVRAMEENRKICFTYKKYGSAEAETRHLKPYGVMEDKRRWYVVGYSEERQEIRTYSLDRIMSLEIMDSNFKMPAGFSLEEKMASSYGAFFPPKQGKPETIIFRCTDKEGMYLRDLPFPRQKILDGDSRGTAERPVVVQVKVYPSYDFYQALMALGSQIEVLSPERVRSDLASKLADATKLYENQNTDI